VSPLSPPLTSGTTVPSSVSSINFSGPNTKEGIQHKVLSTSDTSTTTGVPISEVYKVIPALKSSEGKQKYVCFNCQSNLPTRHYYLQCQQLCMFPAYLGSNSQPHWGNTCPKIAEHLRSKLSIASQVQKDAHFVSNEERRLAFHLHEHSQI